MNRKLRDIIVFVAVSLALVCCIPAMGQVLKGSISGTVTDPQGAVVSGASVKATNLSTGAVLQTTSDSSGLFRFNLIPAAEYKLEISAQKFKTAVQNNIIVSAGRDSGLGSIKLTVGETTTTVEVVADAPLIETSQSQITNTFSGTQLTTFAGVQENEGLDNLALFVPGVTNTKDNTFSNSNGPGFSVNGIRGRNNDQQIDGQNNNDNSVAGPALFVSNPEFISQYVVVTNQFGPEYGRNAGSVVNLITKSGTNNWHGSIYGNENNSVLNTLSNNEKRFQKRTEVPRLNNEFSGFTIGGPWVKNKVFFFGGFDNQIISTLTPYHTDLLLPTPAGLAQLNTCFPGKQNLATYAKFGPYGISAGNPFPTGDPVDGTFTPVNVGTCTGVQFGGLTRTLSTPFHGFDFVAKNDFQLGNNNITARYIFNRGNNFNLDGGQAVLGYPINVTALSQAMLVSWTRNLSSRMVNEARVSFNRLNVDFGGNQIGNTVPTADQVDQSLTQATTSQTGFSNFFGVSTGFPQARIVNTWQGQDNWNLVMGKHTFKAGVNYTFQRSPNIFLPALNGQYRYGSWNSFVNNTPNRVRVANGPASLDFREHDTFVYGGDDWKVSQSLTVNMGLTWSYYGQPANLFNDITVPRESNTASQFWRNDLPLSLRTNPRIPAPKNSFGPSLGFAYAPQWGGWLTGNGKTVFRGGYRFLYDPPFYNIYLNIANSAPEVFLQTFAGASASSKPLPANPTGPVVRGNLAPFLQKGVFDPRTFSQTQVTPNFGPDKVNAWSFGVEREITKNSAIEARYAGNRAYNLFQSVNSNPFIDQLRTDFPNLVPSNLTPCPATKQALAPGQTGTDVGRVSCGTGITLTRNNGGYSSYHAVQVEFRANNLFKQLTVRSSYTFSKTLDNVSEIFSTFGGGNSLAGAQNPLNTTKAEYSFSGLDIPNNWTISFNEQLPFFKEQHGMLGHLLGGWGLSGTYILGSGERYTPIQALSATFTNTRCVNASFGVGLPGDLPCGSSGAKGDYYDVGWWGNFLGAEPARPFLGNATAPITAVAIFAGDACNLFEGGPIIGSGSTLCSEPANQLLSLNAINKTDFKVKSDFDAVHTTKNDVRFVVNGFEAQQVFGTPFGNTPRNPVQDAITSIGTFSVIKNIKMTERTSFEFRTTMLNVFNHPNFTSIDPILEDAGATGFFNGFGDPSLSDSVRRRIFFGATIRF